LVARAGWGCVCSLVRTFSLSSVVIGGRFVETTLVAYVCVRVCVSVFVLLTVFGLVGCMLI
jgi:hypothetical protein